ncbi:MAG: glycosyltransferase family 2 protein [Rhodanobacteraceae bacterium]
MSPLVSIAIPTFDRPAYLKEAVRSALAQTYPNIEVRIGNNGTADVMRGWEPALKDDPRLFYRQNPRTLGMPGTFNALADAARGEFLVAIGDDDRLLPGFVRRLMEEMKPGVNLVFCNHYLINSKGVRLEAASREQTRRYERDQLPAGVLPDAQVAAWQQSIAISAALMRTADMQRVRFREDLNTPDAEYFIRLAQEGATFAFVRDYLVEYRVHIATSTSSGLRSEGLVECLLPMEVSSTVEPYKRKLLGPLLMNAVSRCLRNGEHERARRLLNSGYYPRHATLHSGPVSPLKRWAAATEHAVKSGLQHFCASLPAPIGCPAYRVVRAAKDWTHS